MSMINFPASIAGDWRRFKSATKIPELNTAMGSIIRKLLHDPSSSTETIDAALFECAVRPVLFDRGMSIVMSASPYVRDVFRRRLVECGALVQAMCLAKLTRQPLSRDEIVTLGHQHVDADVIARGEAEEFFHCAEKTEGITELDLRRLHKQLSATV